MRKVSLAGLQSLTANGLKVVDRDGLDLGLPKPAPKKEPPAAVKAPEVKPPDVTVALDRLSSALTAMAAANMASGENVAALLAKVAAELAPKPVPKPAPHGWDIKIVRNQSGRMESLVITPKA